MQIYFITSRQVLYTIGINPNIYRQIPQIYHGNYSRGNYLPTDDNYNENQNYDDDDSSYDNNDAGNDSDDHNNNDNYENENDLSEKV